MRYLVLLFEMYEGDSAYTFESLGEVSTFIREQRTKYKTPFKHLTVYRVSGELSPEELSQDESSQIYQVRKVQYGVCEEELVPISSNPPPSRL